MAGVTFSTIVGGNGTTVTDDSDPSTGLDAGGHRTRFIPALAQLVAICAAMVTAITNAFATASGYIATSVTSQTIAASGFLNFTTQSGKAFTTGQLVVIYNAAGSPSNYMVGFINSYAGTTLQLGITGSGGSGTYASWIIQPFTQWADVLTANGHKFPATQVDSADVNTLDDYEEGTFTPALTFGGASVGLTYNSRSGNYTKIGNRVFGTIRLYLNAIGSSTGAAVITGLPFNCNSDGGGAKLCHTGSGNGLVTVTEANLNVVGSNSNIGMHTNNSSLTQANFQSGNDFVVSFDYKV